MNTPPVATNPIDTVKVYIAAGLISGCGALFFNVVPVFVGALAESFGFDESQLGDIVAAFNIGFTVTAISAVTWVRRINWRLVSALGAFGSAAVLGAMSFFSGFGAIAALSVGLGVTMGALYALILAVLGDSDNPDRAFGLKLGLETLPGALLLFMLPVVIVPIAGFAGVALVLAGTAALLGLATFGLPSRGVKDSAEIVDGAGARSGRHAAWMPVVALASSLLFFTGILASWAFLERIADARGLSPDSVGVVLSIGFIIAGLGGFVAAAIGDRWGRLVPMAGIVVVNCVGLWALSSFGAVGGYAFGACAFLFTVNFTLAYTFGLTAEVDDSGKYVVLSAAALSVGAIIGPVVGGRLAESLGFGALLRLSAACTLASFVAYVSVSMRHRTLDGSRL